MHTNWSHRISPIIQLSALTMALTVLTPSHGVEGQPAGKTNLIGFLGGTSAGDVPLPRFREGLRELGYLEGRNVAFEYRFAEDKNERLPGLAAELVRRKVDVILTHGSPATRAAKDATSTIPIVMVGTGDPVGTGFVASLARPGGNVTGLSTIDVGLAAKRLELLKEAVPKLSHVAVLRNPANPSGGPQLKETLAAARSLGIQTQLFEVRDAKELESAFSVMVKARAGAFTAIADPIFLSQRRRIADLAMTNGLPSVFARNENVEAGGLMSYGPTLTDLFRHAAI